MGRKGPKHRAGAPAAAQQHDAANAGSRKLKVADRVTKKKARRGAREGKRAGAAEPGRPHEAGRAQATTGLNETHPGTHTSTALPGRNAPLSSNWEAIRAVAAAPRKPRKRRSSTAAPPHKKAPGALSAEAVLTDTVAIDCEMVGIAGNQSVLARATVVNDQGAVLFDSFCRPRERIFNFRTKVSGIRPSDLQDAPPFEHVQAKVFELIKGRTLVGHAVANDLHALKLTHPRELLRDTAHYPPLMVRPEGGGKLRPRSLRALAKEFLGLDIQAGEHSPVDDARCALYLYHKHKRRWEEDVAARKVPLPAVTKEKKAKKKKPAPAPTPGRLKRRAEKVAKAAAAAARALPDRPELHDL
ncbi:unnamed protein product [Pedinophyceae sp. YPF-701]|nr:unnamed protein product [Pedinophyceae sp. YPF-701]